MPDRKRPLKVYGGNYGGTWRMIMACHSMAAFKAATGISRDGFCETWNRDEIDVAMTKPGTIFRVRFCDIRGSTPLFWEEFHGT